MCDLPAGGQAVKHLSELLKCFVFIYKTLNHKTDPNKLNKSQWWRKVYEACRAVSVGAGGLWIALSMLSCPHGGEAISSSGAGRGCSGEEWMTPVLFPPAAELLDLDALLLASRQPQGLASVLLKILSCFSLTVLFHHSQWILWVFCGIGVDDFIAYHSRI